MRESDIESGKESTGSGMINTSRATTTHQIVKCEAVLQAAKTPIPLSVLLLPDQEKTPPTVGDVGRIIRHHLRATASHQEAEVPWHIKRSVLRSMATMSTPLEQEEELAKSFWNLLKTENPVAALLQTPNLWSIKNIAKRREKIVTSSVTLILWMNPGKMIVKRIPC